MNEVNCHQESDSQLNRKGYNICVYEHSAITMTKQLKEKVIILNEPGRRTSLYQSCWYGIKTKIKIKPGRRTSLYQ